MIAVRVPASAVQGVKQAPSGCNGGKPIGEVKYMWCNGRPILRNTRAACIRNTSCTGIRTASMCFGLGLLVVGMVACGTSSAHRAIAANHASAIRNATEQPKPPEAPQDVMALAIGPGVMVVWSPPPSNGGAAITKYEVIPSSGSPLVVTTRGTTATLAGLPRGVTYTFTVRATNAAGSGPLSAPSLGVRL